MNKSFLKIGLGLLALAGTVWPSRGAVTGMKTLHGHVPAIVSKMSPTGSVNATNTLHLAIGLPLHNQDQLNALLQQVSDPTSSNYRHYLSPDEFTAQFGPTEQDIQAITKFAHDNGLTVKRVHSNNMLVEVDGKASDIEHAFNVKFHTYHLAAENRDFYAPDQEPSVPATLPVLDVQGLNSYVHPHPMSHSIPPKSSSTKLLSPALGSGPSGNYMGYDFRSAYVPGASLNGAGQSVALLEFDGYISNDITLYEQQAGLPAASLTNILLLGFSGNPVSFNGQLEVTLDIDMVIAMAPGISQVQVYEANSQVADLPNIVLNRIATDNSARQVSCSWGWSGGPSTTTDQIFQQMILQGQTFFHASGDSCAFLPPGSPGSVDDPTRPYAPADSPYITQVGATTLQTTGPGGAFTSESVWNWGNEIGPSEDGTGSSGGISGYYTIPTWQQGISMANNQGSTTMRNTPDVALTGDNIFLIVDGVDQIGVGGTSVAAPLWAGFIAMVNQQAITNGVPAVGFINPAIYALAKTTNYNNYFRDVVQGNNTWSQSRNEFFAVPGYDLCDGLGSPNGTNLIYALVGTPPIAPIFPAPPQPWGNTLSVMDGANPNGLWFLFIQDDFKNNAGGVVNNGWAVNLTTANPVGYAADNELYVSTAVSPQTFNGATNINLVTGASWQTLLAVTNYGPSLSSNAFVTVTLPSSPGVTNVSVSSSIPGSSVATLGSTMIWNIGNMPVGTGGTLTLKFTANTAGSYINAATVSALTTDPNPDDASVVVAVNVTPAAPPSLVPDFVGGANGEFHLSLTNNAGTTYVIEASTNLVNWVPVYTNVSPFTYTNYDVANFSKRFYRTGLGQ